MHQFDDGTLHPVMHFSATFNDAEKNHPQIQKEARALVFGLKKSHFYITGRHFKIHIDHKPLLAIFNPKSGIPAYTAARLQRYAHKTWRGHCHYGNSSFKEEDGYNILEGSDDISPNSFTINVQNKPPITFADIQSATKDSPSLKKVISFVTIDCWPDKKKIIDPDVADFIQHKHDLEIHEGCLLYGERIVIPPKLRSVVVHDLHFGHPGECRMKLLAAEKVFWPNITKDIERAVKTCEICAKVSKTPIKTTLQPWPVPSAPWQSFHIDYAGPIDGNYWNLQNNMACATHWSATTARSSQAKSSRRSVLPRVSNIWPQHLAAHSLTVKLNDL